jgi:hypothetical protein
VPIAALKAFGARVELATLAARVMRCSANIHHAELTRTISLGAVALDVAKLTSAVRARQEFAAEISGLLFFFKRWLFNLDDNLNHVLSLLLGLLGDSGQKLCFLLDFFAFFKVLVVLAFVKLFPLLLLQDLVRLAGVPAEELYEALRPQIGEVVRLQGYKSQGVLRPFHDDALTILQQEPIGTIEAHPCCTAIVSVLLHLKDGGAWYH